ncbi:AraC family transcriptional regulator N-terminal domain-containing protein [Vibrio sp. PP-XX7]
MEHHQSLKAFNVGHLDDDLQRVVVSLVKLHKEKDTIDLFLPLLKKELIYRVFLSDIGAQLLAMVNSNGRDFQLVKSVRWIRHNYAEKISVDQLAEMSAMSVSEVSPLLSYFDGFLTAAISEKTAAASSQTIDAHDKVDAAEAAYSVGYESPSQFNREYRRVYGAPPRTDLRQQSH